MIKNSQSTIANRQHTPRQLKRRSFRMFKEWQPLDKAGERDPELKAIADKFYQAHVELHRLACRRETAEAERKDRRLGNPVLWTVFAPDPILGMKITTRTPHRVIEEQVPTLLDLFGAALFEGKKGLERYQPQARAAGPFDAYEELESQWHPWDREQRLAKVGARVDEVMAAWAKRFETARKREALEAKWQAEREAA